jgi:glutamyl-tRNA reductase
MELVVEIGFCMPTPMGRELRLKAEKTDRRSGAQVIEPARRIGTLFAFGLNHRTAPVEVREKLYLDEDEISELLARYKETLSECLILSTCNRIEVYCVSESRDIDLGIYKNLLVDFKGARGLVREEHFFESIACTASQQLFSIATGIDSKVLGDTQILRQLRNAYYIAQETKATGKVLNQLLQRAFKIGKQSFSETSIHDGAVSASLAAVGLASEVFGSLAGRTVMVLGAGEMARTTIEALVYKNAGKILVSNRTRCHAEELLSSLRQSFAFEGEVVDFEVFKVRLAESDIVISSTGSSEPILTKDDFVDQDRQILLIDIAVPRDIDTSVSENPKVTLKNIDDLNSIVTDNHDKRMKDLPKVRSLITDELVDFLTWYYMLPLLPGHGTNGSKPDSEHKREILRIKEFLSHNVSEIHALFASVHGDFRTDLKNHFALIRKLQTMMEDLPESVVADRKNSMMNSVQAF